MYQHPELNNREFYTANITAKHLNELSLEVQTGIAHTGGVGLLIGGKHSPTIALRGDVDALSIRQRISLRFKSTANLSTEVRKWV
ncbi:MAG: metal-dependent amidase/aminoacylase/carboxypeptidase family protein [Paraglaciecola sp.]